MALSNFGLALHGEAQVGNAIIAWKKLPSSSERPATTIAQPLYSAGALRQSGRRCQTNEPDAVVHGQSSLAALGPPLRVLDIHVAETPRC
jgi:hypothetical protein